MADNEHEGLDYARTRLRRRRIYGLLLHVILGAMIVVVSAAGLFWGPARQWFYSAMPSWVLAALHDSSSHGADDESILAGSIARRASDGALGNAALIDFFSESLPACDELALHATVRVDGTRLRIAIESHGRIPTYIHEAFDMHIARNEIWLGDKLLYDQLDNVGPIGVYFKTLLGIDEADVELLASNAGARRAAARAFSVT